MEIRKISDAVSASPQISAQDVAAIKAAGYVAIINNRPDGEDVNQPLHDDIMREAERLGIPYHFIPVTNVPFAPNMIEKMAQTLGMYDGPVFIFCRTGTRSTFLWAYSQKGKMPGVELVAKAKQAGYDLSKVTHELS